MAAVEPPHASRVAMPTLRTGADYLGWRRLARHVFTALKLYRVNLPPPPGAMALAHAMGGLDLPAGMRQTARQDTPVAETGDDEDDSSAPTAFVVTDAQYNDAQLWAEQQATAVSLLVMSCAADIQAYILDCATIGAVFKVLDARFQIKEAGVLFLAWQDLQSRMDEGADVQAHIDRLVDARGRMSLAGQSISDPLFATIILQSVPPSFDAAVQTIIAGAGKAGLAPDTVTATLVSTQRTSTARHDAEAAFRAKALAVQSTQRTSSPAVASDKQRPICGHCQKLGHVKDDCWTLHPEKRAAHLAKFAAKKAPSVSFASPSASSSSSYFASAKTDTLDVAHASRSSSRRSPKKPHLDSGADRTFFHSRDVFQTYEVFNPPRRIEVANGVTSPAVGIGTVSLVSDRTGERLDMPGCWHAPEFVVDLVSTGELGKLGYASSFEAGARCFIRREGRVILEGANSILEASPALVSDTFSPSVVGKALSAITIQTLHHRLGHPSYAAVEKLIRDDALDGLDIKGSTTMDVGDDINCVACVLGKSTNSSHPPSERIVSAPGELLVFDLVGPISPATVHGERYHLDGVDVYSKAKFTWLLKKKDECEQKILDFIAEWERTHKEDERFKAITLRYDLGSEVGSQAFRDRLGHDGIHFERAARQTPQQIGHAERSHRSIGDSASTMLAAAQLAYHRLPASLWGFAYVTATYIGNHTPRTGTGGKSPLELWTGKRPDISHFRVPFCEAYPLTLKSDRKFKYAPKASEGVFIGYGQVDGFKAYYIYVRATRKIVLTCDVVFREAPIVQASRRSASDPPIVEIEPDEPVNAATDVELKREPVPDRSSVAMPPAGPVEATPPTESRFEVIVEEPAPAQPTAPDVPDEPVTPDMPPMDADQQDLREISLGEIPPDSTPSPARPPTPSVEPEPEVDEIPPPKIIIARPQDRPAPKPGPPRKFSLPVIRHPRGYQPQPFRGPGKGSAAAAIVDPITAAATSPGAVSGRSPQAALACAIPGHRSNERAPDGAFAGLAELPDAADNPGHASRSSSTTSSSTSSTSTSPSSAPSSTCSTCSRSSSTTAELAERKSADPSCVCRPANYTKGLRPPGCAVPASPVTPTQPRSVVIEEDSDDDEAFELPSVAARSAAAVPPRPPRVRHVRIAKKMRRGVRVKAPNPRTRSFFAHNVRDRFDTALGFMAAVSGDGVGLTQAQAHADPIHGQHWIAAEKAELDSLTAKGTFRFMKVPEGHRHVWSHFVYKIKRHADGSIDRYKARLVVNGNKQAPGS